MFDDTLELAENKLILLHILNEIKLPMSNMQLTQIVLENNLINYFTLQQYISELISSNFLRYIDKGEKHRIYITEKGIKVLTLFRNRISENKIDIINEYLKKQIVNIKKEITITADYTIESDNVFLVNLKALENEAILIDIKIPVPSNKQARDLCIKWKNNATSLYKDVIDLLINP